MYSFLPIDATVLPMGASESSALENLKYALVFAVDGERIAIAHIVDRGWCIPGGKLEPGERPEHAARREAYEEAGLTLGPLLPLGYTTRADGDAQRPIAACYLAGIESIEPLSSQWESTEMRLVPWNEIESLYYLWDPLMESMFAYAEKHSVTIQTTPARQDDSRF